MRKSTIRLQGFASSLSLFASQGACLGLAALLLFAGGCSTARDRETPGNIISDLKFRDAATTAVFAHAYRTGSLYQDFRTALLADAIAWDLPLRTHYVEAIQKTYLLSDAQVAELHEMDESEFRNNFTFLVFLFGGTNAPIPLGQTLSPWRVLMEDDDGQLLQPSRIESILPTSRLYLYLNLYFYGMDRWAQTFKITFPKLDKPLTGVPIGSHPIQLIVTGLQGTVRMGWADPRPFYLPEGNPKPLQAAHGS